MRRYKGLADIERGFHVLKLERIERHSFEEERASLLAELKGKAKITVNEAVLAKV